MSIVSDIKRRKQIAKVYASADRLKKLSELFDKMQYSSVGIVPAYTSADGIGSMYRSPYSMVKSTFEYLAEDKISMKEFIKNGNVSFSVISENFRDNEKINIEISNFEIYPEGFKIRVKNVYCAPNGVIGHGENYDATLTVHEENVKYIFGEGFSKNVEIATLISKLDENNNPISVEVTCGDEKLKLNKDQIKEKLDNSNSQTGSEL